MDWSTVVGVIAGGPVNAYFSWQGSKELRREAGNLRQLTKKLMLMMHDAGLIKVEWDRNSNPIRVVELSGTMSGSSSVTGEHSVGHDKKDDDSESTRRRL